MSTPDNIDQFNRVVLHSFDRLYAAFPMPTEINVAEIAALANPASDQAKQTEPSFEILEPTFESLAFLKDEGLLKYSDHYVEGTTLYQAQLTMKGITVLGQTLDSANQESLIARMRSVLRDKAKEDNAVQAQQIVLTLFALAIAATSSANLFKAKP
ncbi:hypothetical protein [Undibacterium sp. Ren11W]|uniref:hypothetical protein n=1 Tax=Undibacterium sp. Ren11W TaxID=3413045 RepID=UPI003BF384CF